MKPFLNGRCYQKNFFQIIFPVFYTTEQMFIYLSKYENIGYTHALWNLKKELKIS